MGTINERLFQLIESDNKSQKELALYLNIDESTISSWKRRGTDPPSEIIMRIAEYFQVPVRYLIEGNLKITDIVDLRYAPNKLGPDDHLTDAEVDFCLKYRQLSPQHKSMIDKIMEIALDIDYKK